MSNNHYFLLANMKQITLLFFVLIISASASELTSDQLKNSNELLRQLKNLRSKIFEGSVSEGAAAKIELRSLLGLSKKQISDSLGKPTYECDGGSVAGCTKSGDIFYSFYTICSSCVGGGPELSLSFNSSGKCTRAKWLISE